MAAPQFSNTLIRDVMEFLESVPRSKWIQLTEIPNLDVNNNLSTLWSEGGKRKTWILAVQRVVSGTRSADDMTPDLYYDLHILERTEGGSSRPNSKGLGTMVVGILLSVGLMKRCPTFLDNNDPPPADSWVTPAIAGFKEAIPPNTASSHHYITRVDYYGRIVRNHTNIVLQDAQDGFRMPDDPRPLSKREIKANFKQAADRERMEEQARRFDMLHAIPDEGANGEPADQE